MKAVVREDIIVYLTEKGDTEIGEIPKGVGLERLRWDGEKVVDLAGLNQIWVREVNGVFELHAVKVNNSVLVDMAYADRKRLKVVPGNGIHVLTTEEISELKEKERVKKLRANVAAHLEKSFGNLTAQNQLVLLALIASLIVYSRTENSAVGNWFDEIIPHLKDMFPLDKTKPVVEDYLKEAKKALDRYFSELAN